MWSATDLCLGVSDCVMQTAPSPSHVARATARVDDHRSTTSGAGATTLSSFLRGSIAPKCERMDLQAPTPRRDIPRHSMGENIVRNINHNCDDEKKR